MKESNDTSVSLNEHLSALLDDEAGSFEQRRLIDELTSADSDVNSELCGKLASYSLIGEAMRNSSTPDATIITGNSFLAGIHEQIKAEDQYDSVQIEEVKKPAANNSSWLKPVGGFAIAASVAALAVVGMQNYQQINVGQAPVIASNPVIEAPTKLQKSQLSVAEMDSATIVSAADIVQKTDKDTIAMANVKDAVEAAIDKEYSHADARTRSLLKRYVDSHIQFATHSTFVPSVRVIAYSDY